MKKILFVIAIIFSMFPTINSNAQSRLGVVVGGNISDLDLSQPLISVNQAPGFMVGIKGDLTIPGIGFGIDAALQYDMRGAKINLGEKEIWEHQGYGEHRSMLHYLEVPIHVRWMYSKMNGFEKKFAPYVFVGPSFSFLVGHNQIDALKYATMAFSMDFGIGFQLFENWQLTASYDLGLSYAVKTKLLDDFSAKNNSWKVTLTYYFH